VPGREAARLKAIAAECGFPDVEVVFDEWHFLAENNWDAIRGDREDYIRTHTGPASMNGTDSAAFTLAVEAKMQDSCISQAFFYGCGFEWDWGYFDAASRRYVKPYYAVQMMGELIGDCPKRVACSSSDKGVTPFAAVSADGRRASVLVADYRSGLDKIEVKLCGAEGWRLSDVRVLDDKNDLAPFAATLDGDRIVLKKNDAFSSCFAIRLEK